MVLPATTVWEVRLAGNDTNGGAFDSAVGGSTDYSQQDTKNTTGSNISTTDAVANGTTTITSATGAFTSVLAGNVIYLSGGSGSIAAQWRKVVSVTNATTIVIDATIAASTGMTMNIGGALASPGMAMASVVASNWVYVKGGPYVCSATANVSGGKIQWTVNGTGPAPNRMIGYTTTRGDGGYATLQAGANSMSILQHNVGAFTQWDNIALALSGAQTTVTGITAAGNGYMNNCKFTGLATSANCTTGALVLFRCQSFNHTSVGLALVNQGSIAFGCYVTGGTAGSGYQLSAGAYCVDCIAYNNAGNGFQIAGIMAGCINCISYGNTGASGDGFRLNNTVGLWTLMNCIGVNNAQKNFNDNNAPTVQILSVFNCAGYNPGVADTLGALAKTGFVTLTADPCKNAAGGDFSPSSTAGGGAACRGAGYPVTIPGISTNDFRNIGMQDLVNNVSAYLGANMRGGFIN